MNRHIFHSLSQAQCIQITALHALCAPEKRLRSRSLLFYVLCCPIRTAQKRTYFMAFII